MPITVTRDTSQPLRQVVKTGDHLITVDATVAEGGGDSGPSPHDLYDAALGSCTAITVAWYANRKGIPLKDVQVTVERDASAERQGVYRLSAALHLGGDLTDAQRQDLLAVARKCPVHKLMTTVTTEITTDLA